jgi:hypothetical protein
LPKAGDKAPAVVLVDAARGERKLAVYAG